MSSKLKASVAGMALLAVLGAGFANAQTAPAPAEAPAATAPAAVAVPDILQGDAFSAVTSAPGRRGGLKVEGTIAETGKSFDALVNDQGQLVAMRTADGAALPAAVVEALLPEAARANPVLPEITVLNAIGTRDGAVMASGQDASGDEVRIGFDAEGELMLFDRGGREGRGGWMGHDGGMRGERGDHDGMRGERGDHDGMRGERGEHDGMRGERGEHDGMRGKHGDHGDREGRDPGREMAPEGMPPAIDESALRGTLESGGYTALAGMRPTRGGILIEATNPQGEEVLVTVTPEGEVVRETAR